MIQQAKTSQPDFYREFLMARVNYDPKDYGVDMDRDAFIELMVEWFGSTYRGMWSIDELCLHPSEAMRFCGDIRRTLGSFDLPDDIILRAIMQRRKNPGG